MQSICAKKCLRFCYLKLITSGFYGSQISQPSPSWVRYGLQEMRRDGNPGPHQHHISLTGECSVQLFLFCLVKISLFSP